jgi:DNA-binding transcriptional LysR family regulator
MDLADVALFRAIVRAGSLSAAGRQVGAPPMVVSRRLAALEAEVGARLIHRTTRSMSLTPEGEAFLPHALALLETRDAALASVENDDTGLTGTLKVTAPNVIGHSVVVPIVADLISNNPLLSVDLTLSDSVLDIAAAGLDVAIRVSPLAPSDLIITKLANNPYVLCASPTYISRSGAPTMVGELAAHALIRLHTIDAWPFRVAGELQRVRINGRLSANTVDAVRAACLAGVGIAMMTYWDVRHLVQEGSLKQISLVDANPDSLGIWAVFPSRKHMPLRVRTFINVLRERLLADHTLISDS